MNSQTVRAAVAKPGADLFAEVMQIDHNLLDAGAAQQFQGKFDHRPPRDFDQRLGHCVGERPQAVAFAGGENHGPHRHQRGRYFRNTAAMSAYSVKRGRTRSICRTVEGT